MCVCVCVCVRVCVYPLCKRQTRHKPDSHKIQKSMCKPSVQISVDTDSLPCVTLGIWRGVVAATRRHISLHSARLYLSLAGADTSIICFDKSFVVTNICRDKGFVFCRDKRFVATSILLLRQKMCFVATNTRLSRHNFCQNK